MGEHGLPPEPKPQRYRECRFGTRGNCAADTFPGVELSRRLKSTAAASFVVLAVLAAQGRVGLVALILALGVGTVVPLGASLALRPERDGRHGLDARIAGALVVVTSLLGTLSLVLSSAPGLAVVASGVHVVSSFSLAVAAARRLAFRGLAPLDELAVDAGSLFLPVGAVFLFASHAGLSPIGFREPIVTFTAAHFHYAGFAAPTVLGCVGRLAHAYGAPTSRAYRVGAITVVAGIPLTALGITFGPAIERVAGVLLASGMLVASVHGIATAVRLRDRSTAARVVLALAFLGLVVPMGLAATFALTGSAGRGGQLSEVVPLAAMIRFHGAVNALVFALPALVACVRLGAQPRHAPLGFPISELRGAFHIGADYFARSGAQTEALAPPGIVDRLEEYARPGFDPAVVHPDVRAFYERTSEWSLEVTPTWSSRFRVPGLIWRRIARVIGQVALPTEAPNGDAVKSRIVALDPKRDGRQGARGWVRTYASTGEALYVAAYAATPSRDRVLMNIAFPLPGSALISVLRFDDGAEPGSLRVTTRGEPSDSVPDEGIYLGTRLFTLRLPMHEWVDVRPGPEPGVTLAVHELFLCGHRYLRLDYRITARASASA